MAAFHLEQWCIWFLTIFGCTVAVYATTDIIVIVGTTANMVCPATQSVEWKFRAVGMRLPGFVYINNEITKTYKAGGRHDVNSDTGSSELVITNVMTSDAGTYTCTEEVGSSRVNTFFELTILHAPPVCSSNVSLENVLIENDCGIEPDYVQFSCSILYSGNAVPVLKWNYSSELNDQSEEWTTSNHFNKTETFLTFKANNRLCDERLACAVQTTATIKPNECVLPRMSKQYFFNNGFQLLELPKSDFALDDVKCAANTSCHECEYDWIKVNNSKSISDGNSEIRWSEVGPGTYKCVATCQLRNQQCSAEPMLLVIIEDDVSKFNTTAFLTGLVVLLSITCLCLAIVVVIFRKNKNNFSHLMRRLTGSRHSEIKAEEEQLPLMSGQPGVFDEKTLSKLIDNLDANNGLAEYLRSKQILSAEEYNELTKESNWKSYQEQNRALLKIIFANDTTSSIREIFVESLKETGQEHIAKFIQRPTTGRNSADETSEEDQLMTGDDLSRIDGNMYALTKLINSYDHRFLNFLLQKKCLTERQLDRINEHRTRSARNMELLSIIRRRSSADFHVFKIALLKTKQHGVLKLLDNGEGNLFEIKCDLTIENDSTSLLLSPTTPEIKELEIEICDLLTASKNLNRQQRHAVANCLFDIQASLITLIGASPTGSILFYFLCETSQSILAFEQMLESGRLREIIERLVNCVLDSSSKHLTVTISWDEECLNKCIDRAHKTVQMEGNAKNSEYPTRSRKIDEIPTEVTEIILHCASVRMMKILWTKYQEENMTNFDPSSSNFEFYHTKILSNFRQVFAVMSSVSFKWSEIFSRRRILGFNILKEFVMFNIGINRQFVVTILDVKHGFMDMLEQCHVITNIERQELGDDVGQLLRHLRTKKYTHIMSFLQSLEDTQQSHVLNYVICQAVYSPSHGDVWPIDNDSVSRIKDNLKQLVNCIDLTVYIEITSTKTKQRTDGSGNMPRAFSDDRNVPTPKTLTDLLFDRMCISFVHKGSIDIYRDAKTQNGELLQLLLKGSVVTFRTTVNYLEKTGQQQAAEILSLQSFSYQDQVGLSESECVTGITWSADRYYIVFENSKKIVIFRQKKFSVSKEDDTVEVPEMISPCDIISSTQLGSVVVGDKHSKCLWIVPTLNEDKTQDIDRSKSISKWLIEDTPMFLSSTDEDSLLVISSSSCIGSTDSENIDFSLDVYNLIDRMRVRNIPLPNGIRQMWHAIQLRSGQCLIAYELKTRTNILRVVSKITVEGDILQTVVLTEQNSNSLSLPMYMVIAAKDRALILDDDKIFVFDEMQTDRTHLEIVYLNKHSLSVFHSNRIGWLKFQNVETIVICQSGVPSSFSIWHKKLAAKTTQSDSAEPLRQRFSAAGRKVVSDIGIQYQ